ncbi:MAG: ribonuclease Y [Ktedonobacterales bacterium]|nr:ribonuclease Y [Ktedonobacterales bacterium]
MPIFLVFILIAVAAAGGYGAARYLTTQQDKLQLEEQLRLVREEHEDRLMELQRQQSATLRETKEENARARATLESELRERRTEARASEQRMQQREETLDRKAEAQERRERAAAQREQDVARQHEQLEAQRGAIERDRTAAKQEMAREREALAQELTTLRAAFAQERQHELERVAVLSRDEARAQVIASIEEGAREDAMRRVREIEAQAREEADARAREIITLAIQRCASDQVSEVAIAVVPLPNDEMKGRIIGREGRNIRTLEAATGVDLVIDDTPDTVILSSFDPVRREVARIALTKLIIDGRIHPARIEEMVEKARQEVETVIREEGERALVEANVVGIQTELAKMIGRLHFRTSYGQNVLNHSIEVAVLAGIMASELGADAHVCKVAGLMHDLGKAFDQEIEGPHALISGEIAKRFGKSPEIVHAIVAHHAMEGDPMSLEAVIVQAADAISASRPGGRRETVELYMKRLDMLEQIANSFTGVEKSFAVQAGREVRIIVKPEEINEFQANQLARDVARKIEESMDYPGQIKIAVVRETRSVEYAK